MSQDKEVEHLRETDSTGRVVVVRDSRPGMMQYGLGGILNQSLNLGSHGVNSAAVYGNMPTSWPIRRTPSFVVACHRGPIANLLLPGTPDRENTPETPAEPRRRERCGER